MTSWKTNGTKHRRPALQAHGPRGFTLVEMLLVAALMAGVMAALVPLLRAVNQGWEVGSSRIEVVQNARVALDTITRDLRQMRRVDSVSAPGDGNGFIEFYDRDDVLRRVDAAGAAGFLQYGPQGAQSLLAGPVQSLTFSCYDMAGDLMPHPVETIKIRSVAVDATVVDAENRVVPYELGTRVFLRRDSNVVINEIMYNPLAIGSERKYEWLELYNPSDQAVDLSGWVLTSRKHPDQPDIILGDERYGTGAAVIPVGGYAVVTCDETEVYHELLGNRSFEEGDLWMWVDSGGWSRVKDGDAHEGKRKYQRQNSGWALQLAYLPFFSNSIFFSCWEKTPAASPESTRIVITVRDLLLRVLVTVYDGPAHADWTQHMVNLSAYDGYIVAVCVETMTAGTYWIDDFTANWSLVDQDALRVCVEDKTVAGQLENNYDTVVLDQMGTIADSVSYEDDWGGDGNTRTLERISPTGGSSDPDNWDQGPIAGTPGWRNEASR